MEKNAKELEDLKAMKEALENVKSEDSVLPERIDGDLDLRSLKDAEGLVLPKKVEGDLDFGKRKDEDFKMLKEAVKNATTEELDLVKRMSENLIRKDEGLDLPKKIDGKIEYVDGILLFKSPREEDNFEEKPKSK